MYRILIIVLVYLIIKNIRKNHFINIVDKKDKDVVDSDANGLKMSDGSVNDNLLNLISEYYHEPDNKIIHDTITIDSLDIPDVVITDDGTIKSDKNITTTKINTTSITVPKLVIEKDQELCIGDDVCLTGDNIKEIKNNKEYCIYNSDKSKKYCITGDDIKALNNYDTNITEVQGYIKGEYIYWKNSSHKGANVWYHLYPGNNEIYSHESSGEQGTCIVSLHKPGNEGTLAVNPGYRVIGRNRSRIVLVFENNSNYVYNMKKSDGGRIDGGYDIFYNGTNKVPDSEIIYYIQNSYPPYAAHQFSSIELQKI